MLSRGEQGLRTARRQRMRTASEHLHSSQTYTIYFMIIVYHIISYDIIAYHIISYHIISYHIISCYIIVYYSAFINAQSDFQHSADAAGTTTFFRPRLVQSIPSSFYKLILITNNTMCVYIYIYTHVYVLYFSSVFFFTNSSSCQGPL